MFLFSFCFFGMKKLKNCPPNQISITPFKISIYFIGSYATHLLETMWFSPMLLLISFSKILVHPSLSAPFTSVPPDLFQSLPQPCSSSLFVCPPLPDPTLTLPASQFHIVSCDLSTTPTMLRL